MTRPRSIPRLRRRLAAGLLALGTASGCGASWQLQGRVSAGAGLALRDAQVLLVGPASGGARVEPRARLSGADGRFSIDGSGRLPMACTVEVDKRGYGPRRFSVGEVCAVREAAGCASAEVNADLPLAEGELRTALR